MALQDNPIHSISIGQDPKSGMKFTVGQSIYVGNDELIVSRILRSEEHYHRFGQVIYIVFAKDDKGVEFPYKYSDGLPVYVSCFRPKDQVEHEIS